MKKKKSSGGGGANWMDTYGDMVTLLLCFFVLLYSMSTISEDKWKAIVQSFNPGAIETVTETSGDLGPLAEPSDIQESDNLDEIDINKLEEMQSEVDDALQELYETLQRYVEESGMQNSIVVTKGDGYVFISFNDAVFFNGDSAVLREDGKVVLDVVSAALNRAAPYLDEVRVMGHTAQALKDQPNTIVGDRTLASNRANNAVIYIQERTQENLSPARLIGVGYGQWRPVDLNNTEEQRVHNRRVEILITGQDLLNQLGDSIQQYYTSRTGGEVGTKPYTEDGASAEGDADAEGGTS